MLVIVGILLFIIFSNSRQPEKKKNFVRQAQTEEPLPYYKRRYFFTKREKAFFNVLDDIIDRNNYLLFAKVRVLDILNVKKTNPAKKGR